LLTKTVCKSCLRKSQIHGQGEPPAALVVLPRSPGWSWSGWGSRATNHPRPAPCSLALPLSRASGRRAGWFTLARVFKPVLGVVSRFSPGIAFQFQFQPPLGGWNGMEWIPTEEVFHSTVEKWNGKWNASGTGSGTPKNRGQRKHSVANDPTHHPGLATGVAGWYSFGLPPLFFVRLQSKNSHPT